MKSGRGLPAVHCPAACPGIRGRGRLLRVRRTLHGVLLAGAGVGASLRPGVPGGGPDDEAARRVFALVGQGADPAGSDGAVPFLGGPEVQHAAGRASLGPAVAAAGRAALGGDHGRRDADLDGRHSTAARRAVLARCPGRCQPGRGFVWPLGYDGRVLAAGPERETGCQLFPGHDAGEDHVRTAATRAASHPPGRLPRDDRPDHPHLPTGPGSG